MCIPTAMLQHFFADYFSHKKSVKMPYVTRGRIKRLKQATKRLWKNVRHMTQTKKVCQTLAEVVVWLYSFLLFKL